MRYMDWDFESGSMFCGGPALTLRAYCHPDNFKGASNVLLHQKSDGTFEDVTTSAQIADPAGKGLGVAFADFDNDGWTDVFVANDSVRQSLYRNKGDGSFEDIAVMSGAAYDDNGRTFAGMGIDCADYDNDGYSDIFITTLSNEKYALYLNNGDRSFTYTTNTSGVGQITLLYSGWGTRFVDVDNDGLRDLFVAQGHVLDTVEKSTAYLKYEQPLLLMRNTGKSFVNVSATAGAPFKNPIAARGAAFGDLNNDGQLDIVVGVLDSSPLVLRNTGTRNHWIGVALTGSRSNRQGLGARVIVTDNSGKKQFFEVTTAGSYISSNDPRILVGLGPAKSVRSVEVRWPSGAVSRLGPVDANTAMWVREAAARNAMPTIDKLDDPDFFPYRYGHAFWAYVAGRWGDQAVGDVERREQRGDPVAVIVVGAPLGHARHHRQDRLRALQGLDLRLLVDTQHDRRVRRVHVEPDEGERVRPKAVQLPHPDDEVLGAGATMASLSDQGVAVHALVLGQDLRAPRDLVRARMR